MSFDYDPYTVMTVVTRKNDDGKPIGVSFLCDSCGGGWREMLPLNAPVSELRTQFDHHLALGHNLTRGETQAWHQGH